MNYQLYSPHLSSIFRNSSLSKFIVSQVFVFLCHRKAESQLRFLIQRWCLHGLSITYLLTASCCAISSYSRNFSGYYLGREIFFFFWKMKHTFTIPADFLVVAEEKIGQNCYWGRAARGNRRTPVSMGRGTTGEWACGSVDVQPLFHKAWKETSTTPLHTQGSEIVVCVPWLLALPILT